ALVTGPRVVFADEPTGALDSLAGEQLMDELTCTARADGITLVIVTHDNRVAMVEKADAVADHATFATQAHSGSSDAGASAGDPQRPRPVGDRGRGPRPGPQVPLYLEKQQVGHGFEPSPRLLHTHVARTTTSP
ncbi:hypothetical protein AB0C30_59250, partial [Nonomuraea sp. NPDC048901]